MKQFVLGFGKGSMTISLPEKNILAEVEGNEYPAIENIEAEVKKVLRNPIGSAPLKDIVKAGEKVGTPTPLFNRIDEAKMMAEIEKELLGNKEVTEVIYHKGHIDTVNRNIKKAALLLLTLLVLLTVISWSLISNLVRLSIYSKRFLLHTMKLVGATWGFIRRPFLLHNMWIGLAAGAIANALLGTAIYMIQQRAPEMAQLLPIKELAIVGAAVMLFGVVICTLCAFLSVNRFLRMRNNDLYFI